MDDGSWVGVDVHAGSAVAGVLDGASGELNPAAYRSLPPSRGRGPFAGLFGGGNKTGANTTSTLVVGSWTAS
jgi:hypothetical protein